MPVETGVPAVVALSPDRAQPGVVHVYAVVALHRRGLALLAARSALAEMMAHGATAVLLPTVEDASALIADLDEAGCTAVVGAGGPGRAMLRRVRAAMGLPDDMPTVMDAADAPLQ